eukprot:TRINITY_DN7093_c0_g1_i1.p3 TRINITY_DN7093_c0_g1~~TRINITY_DN7093_c0_g1_i1.p3  ORF type:complete len:111 (-),score=2.79 TRINITY_DN7093_c0_g1_i1:107-439(-)
MCIRDRISAIIKHTHITSQITCFYSALWSESISRILGSISTDSDFPIRQGLCFWIQLSFNLLLVLRLITRLTLSVQKKAIAEKSPCKFPQSTCKNINSCLLYTSPSPRDS